MENIAENQEEEQRCDFKNVLAKFENLVSLELSATVYVKTVYISSLFRNLKKLCIRRI